MDREALSSLNSDADSEAIPPLRFEPALIGADLKGPRFDRSREMVVIGNVAHDLSILSRARPACIIAKHVERERSTTRDSCFDAHALHSIYLIN